jgi:N-formylglutamate amidohydrolase
MSDHAVLLDCHSMPPRRRGLAQVVVGDRHGESAEPWVASTALDVAAKLGFSVALNSPFAGGHITRHHGDPSSGRHAIQIEVDRSLYCRMDGMTPGPGFERVALLFDRLVGALGQAALERGLLQAAE